MRGVCSFTVKELQWFIIQENGLNAVSLIQYIHGREHISWIKLTRRIKFELPLLRRILKSNLEKI